MTEKGLAVDIDDSLADTAATCFQIIFEKYGQLTDSSLSELIRQYQQPGSVPAWQAHEIQELVREIIEDPDWLSQLPSIEGAAAALQQLTRTVPISLYVTSRLTHHRSLTEEWLLAHGFPLAPVKLRTKDVTRPDWKLAFLADNYPTTYGLIDNELGFLPVEKHTYQGRLIWFNRYQTPTLHSQLLEFSDWSEIGRILKS